MLVHQWERITGLHAEQDHQQTLFLRWGIVEEEADETIYWMELLIEAKLLQENDISHLLREANQILAMTVSSIKTARRKSKK